MKKTIIFILFFIIFILSNFSQVNNNSEKTTIEFKKDDNGYVQYFTNDPANYAAGVIGTPKENTNGNGFEMEIIKDSGSENVGCGMIFGAQDANNWYAVLIDPNGNFEIVKSENLKLISLAKGNSKQIIKGLSKTNIIKVIQKRKTYEIYLNNNKNPLFILKNIDIKGNGIGYFVMVGDSKFESFPQKPLDIRFKIKE